MPSSNLAGSRVHCPLLIMSVNSSRRNSICSLADLWGPLPSAAARRPVVHSGAVVLTAAPKVPRVASRGAAGVWYASYLGVEVAGTSPQKL